jgi:hypothetical protein
LRVPSASRAGTGTSALAGTLTLTAAEVKYAGRLSARAWAVWAPFGTLGSEKRPPLAVVPVWPPIETPTLGRRTISPPSALPLPFSS